MLLWGLRQVLSIGSNKIPLRTKFDTQGTVISHRRRKFFLPLPVDLLFRREFTDRRHNKNNTGFGDKSMVFLHFPRKFKAGQLSLVSMNFDFQNVIFQPMVFPFVWTKYKRNLWEMVASSPFLGPSRLPRSLARSRGAHFARPNRRACSQAIKFHTRKNNNSVGFALWPFGGSITTSIFVPLNCWYIKEYIPVCQWLVSSCLRC